MRDWLHTRGRAFLSLLSDFGGALGFVVVATAFIAAAMAGAVLFALEVFPQPFLTLLIIGIGLLAAGLALHFLQARLAQAPYAGNRLPSKLPLEKDEGNPRRPVEDNPYSGAASLQRQHERVKARKAIRRIREELRDNRRHVQRASEGDIRKIREISSRVWGEEEGTLLELANPQPHSSARQAYRELEGILDVVYIRESPTTLTIRKQPLDLLETDVHTTFEAIDEAIDKLNEEEND